MPSAVHRSDADDDRAAAGSAVPSAMMGDAALSVVLVGVSPPNAVPSAISSAEVAASGVRVVTGGSAPAVEGSERQVAAEEVGSWAQRRGFVALEAPAHSARQVHQIMASVARMCLARAAERRSREQAREVSIGSHGPLPR